MTFNERFKKAFSEMMSGLDSFIEEALRMEGKTILTEEQVNSILTSANAEHNEGKKDMAQLQVVISGGTIGEVVKNAQAWVKANSSTGATQATSTKTKKKAALVEDEEEIELDEAEESDFEDADFESDEEVEIDEEETEDEEVEEEEEEKPKKKKSKKLDVKDVNTALMAYSKKHTRPKALAILNKKFKVKSVLELKPEQYAQVIAALK